jgi:predicted DNA-binding protein (MmcQ/YjbR family)
MSMNREEFNEFCRSLPETTHVVQWGDADVWKVGGKVFAIAGWDDGDVTAITFKTSPTEYDFLIQMPGLRPAPYLASRGFTWVQHFELPGLDDNELREHIEDSHRTIVQALTKRLRSELGLTDDPPAT